MKTSFALVGTLLLFLAGASTSSAFYNPQTGRWLSRDPLADEAVLRDHLSGRESEEQERILNRSRMPVYVFANNAAILFVDPLGLEVIGTRYQENKIAGIEIR